ncbi:hypothetical protein ACJMK2_008916 [Sinanodonta woodiana]|uniref:Uncharacterized protein n=1 Tax=Sinanodonta woodiana TaxID=1069815 RepID=A0ABD3VCY9_SINWO
MEELKAKIHQRLGVRPMSTKMANIGGWSHITSGARIINVSEEDANQIVKPSTEWGSNSTQCIATVRQIENNQSVEHMGMVHGTAKTQQMQPQLGRKLMLH